jgi:hypothetical protein
MIDEEKVKNHRNTQRKTKKSMKHKTKAQIIEDKNENHEEYDDEEESHSFSSGADGHSLEVDSIYFFSQQPHEVHDIILHPLNEELIEYLQKDEIHNWRFEDPLIKKQIRSLSMDKTIPYQMGEDEEGP